jgi:hypothetical protein
MFNKNELEFMLVAINRSNWNGQEAESVAFMKQKVNAELKKLDEPVKEVKKDK